MSFKYFKDDFQASIVVFLVALPLCLSVALASDAPLFSGLLGGLIGGALVSLFSGSQLSISAPGAGFTVVIANSIHQLGSFEVFTLAVLIAGVFQLILGAIKGGNIGDYFPNAVIRGLLAGIGIAVILKQKSPLLGITEKIQWSDFTNFLDLLQPGAAFIGVFSLVALSSWKILEKKIPFLKYIPSALFVVMAGVLFNFLFLNFFPQFHLSQKYLVNLQFEGGFKLLLDKLFLPQWEAFTRWDVYREAVVMAVVGSLEALLCLDAIDSMDKKKRTSPKNRELLAQGTGNVLCGLTGAIPITGAILTSTVNVSAGAKTKLAAFLQGFFFIICLLFISKWMNLIPLATLSAVIIFVCFKLTPPSLYKTMFSLGNRQSLPFLSTTIIVAFIDLLWGVIFGVGFSVFFLIRATLNEPFQVYDEKGTKIIRFMKDASFLNKPLLSGILHSIPNGSTVIIDSVSPVKIDRDIILVFESFLASCKERNIKVKFKKLSFSDSEFSYRY